MSALQGTGRCLRYCDNIIPLEVNYTYIYVGNKYTRIYINGGDIDNRNYPEIYTSEM